MLRKIGIITALRSEAGCLTHEKPRPAELHQIGEHLLLLLCGMGESRVKHAIDLLLKQNVEGLISFGTAGALGEGIKPGDIIIPEKIIDANGNSRIVSTSWRGDVLRNMQNGPFDIHQGDIVTTNKVIAGCAEKAALHEKTAAIAVDMESSLVISAADKHNLPALALRIIVDDADMTVPDTVLRLSDAFGQVALMSLLGNLVRQPVLIRELIKLGKAFRAAKQSMQWIGQHTDLLLMHNG